MPCCVAEVVDMRDQLAFEAASLSPFSRLRTIVPLVLICSEHPSGGSTALCAWCDVLVVRRQGFDDDAPIARAVGRYWRRQLGNALIAAMRDDAPKAVRAVRAIFESDVVPSDTGALSRVVGCSREHVARELEGRLPGGGIFGQDDA